MFNLGDVLVRLLLGDTSPFRQQIQKEAEVSGDKAGKTMGERLSQKLKTGLGAAAGGLFVGAVEQASKFEDQLRTINTVAKLSDDQLRSVGDGIKSLSAETGKSLEDLTGGFYDLVSAGIPADKAMDVLRNSAILATGALGTTGEAVDLMTSALGAFNIPADQSSRLMDVFAQSVADGKTTVAELSQGFGRLAPVASAFGLSIDEVISSTALLTLNGGSASQAMTYQLSAINALLTPNAKLLELQKELGVSFADIAKEKGLAVALEELRNATHGSTEEFGFMLGSSEALNFGLSVTGENAQAAADELARVKEGADKGGVGMDQFNEKMKSPIEQGKRLVATLTNVLVTVGGPFVGAIGPAIFAINQLGQAFGLQGIAAKAFGAVLGGLAVNIGGPVKRAILGAFASAEIGTRLETLGLQASTAWIKGMTKVDRLKDALRGIWDRVVNSGPVQAAIGAAGADAGRIYAVASAALAPLTSALTGAWAATGAKVVAAAGATGTLAGTAFTVAAAAAIVAAPLIVLKVALDIQGEVNQQGEELKSQVSDYIKVATDTDLANSIEGVRKELDKIPGNAFDARNKVIDVLNVMIAEQNRRLGGAVPELHDSSRGMGVAIATGVRDGINETVPSFVTTAIAAIGPVMGKAAHDGGLRAAQALAQGMQDGKEAVKTQWNSFLDILKNAEKPAKERARLIGELASKELQKGLKSQDPYVRATAQTTKQLIIDRLNELKSSAKNIGKDGMEALRRAMRSKDPDIRAAARAIYNAANTPISKLPAAMEKWGAAAARRFAAGIRSEVDLVASAAGAVSKALSNHLRAQSPTKEGPLSTLGGPEGWGAHIAKLFAQGLFANLPNFANVLGGSLPFTPMPAMAGMTAPRSSFARGIGAVPYSAAPGSKVTTVNVKVDGLLKARDPLELAYRLQRFASRGWFEDDEDPQ